MGPRFHVEIDGDGVLRMGGTFPEGGVRRIEIDALVMPLCELGKKYACRINDGLKFHATPTMVSGQFAMLADVDLWPALAHDARRTAQ